MAVPTPSSTDAQTTRGGALSALAPLLVLLARLWLATLRLRLVDLTGLASDDSRAWVLAFFHGTQVPLMVWPRRRLTSVLVSWSRDGSLLASLLAALGMLVVRGSTSRGAARGLRALVRTALSGQADVALAVDGPRGPRGTIHPGALACARLCGGRVIPMGAAAARARVLWRSWDHCVLPLPFSKVVVVLGPPLPADTCAARLGEAIRAANHRAEIELTGSDLDGQGQKVA